jgi:hypothetical protein
MTFDKSRPDYDPDLDFDNLSGVCETLRLGLPRGNSIKSQLEELWQRKGVVQIAHGTRWTVKGGRVIGAARGLLKHRPPKVKIPKRKKQCSQYWLF